MPIEIGGSFASFGSESASRAFDAANRSLFTAEPTYYRDTTYLEQLGANFRQENIVWSGLSRSIPDYPADPQYNPADDLGFYEEYVERFPQLLDATNRHEMQWIKGRIEQEIEDRRKIESGSLLWQLWTGAPAALLSPENLLPIGGVVKGVAKTVKNAYNAAVAAKVTGVAAKRTFMKDVLRTAGLTGAEAAVAQSMIEPILQDQQGLRTDEEAVANIVGAGALGGILGGGFSALGYGFRKTLGKVFGAEFLSDAQRKTAVQMHGPGGTLSPERAAQQNKGVNTSETPEQTQARREQAARNAVSRVERILEDSGDDGYSVYASEGLVWDGEPGGTGTSTIEWVNPEALDAVLEEGSRVTADTERMGVMDDIEDFAQRGAAPIRIGRAAVNSASGTVTMIEGRHRVAWAKSRGLDSIPIVVNQSQREALKSLLGDGMREAPADKRTLMPALPEQRGVAGALPDGWQIHPDDRKIVGKIKRKEKGKPDDEKSVVTFDAERSVMRIVEADGTTHMIRVGKNRGVVAPVIGGKLGGPMAMAPAGDFGTPLAAAIIGPDWSRSPDPAVPGPADNNFGMGQAPTNPAELVPWAEKMAERVVEYLRSVAKSEIEARAPTATVKVGQRTVGFQEWRLGIDVVPPDERGVEGFGHYEPSDSQKRSLAYTSLTAVLSALAQRARAEAVVRMAKDRKLRGDIALAASEGSATGIWSSRQVKRVSWEEAYTSALYHSHSWTKIKLLIASYVSGHANSAGPRAGAGWGLQHILEVQASPSELEATKKQGRFGSREPSRRMAEPKFIEPDPFLVKEGIDDGYLYTVVRYADVDPSTNPTIFDDDNVEYPIAHRDSAGRTTGPVHDLLNERGLLSGSDDPSSDQFAAKNRVWFVHNLDAANLLNRARRQYRDDKGARHPDSYSADTPVLIRVPKWVAESSAAGAPVAMYGKDTPQAAALGVSEVVGFGGAQTPNAVSLDLPMPHRGVDSESTYSAKEKTEAMEASHSMFFYDSVNELRYVVTSAELNALEKGGTSVRDFKADLRNKAIHAGDYSGQGAGGDHTYAVYVLDRDGEVVSSSQGFFGFSFTTNTQTRGSARNKGLATASMRATNSMYLAAAQLGGITSSHLIHPATHRVRYKHGFVMDFDSWNIHPDELEASITPDYTDAYMTLPIDTTGRFRMADLLLHDPQELVVNEEAANFGLDPVDNAKRKSIYENADPSMTALYRAEMERQHGAGLESKRGYANDKWERARHPIRAWLGYTQPTRIPPKERLTEDRVRMLIAGHDARSAVLWLSGLSDRLDYVSHLENFNPDADDMSMSVMFDKTEHLNNGVNFVGGNRFLRILADIDSTAHLKDLAFEARELAADFTFRPKSDDDLRSRVEEMQRSIDDEMTWEPSADESASNYSRLLRYGKRNMGKGALEDEPGIGGIHLRELIDGLEAELSRRATSAVHVTEDLAPFSGARDIVPPIKPGDLVIHGNESRGDGTKTVIPEDEQVPAETLDPAAQEPPPEPVVVTTEASDSGITNAVRNHMRGIFDLAHAAKYLDRDFPGKGEEVALYLIDKLSPLFPEYDKAHPLVLEGRYAAGDVPPPEGITADMVPIPRDQYEKARLARARAGGGAGAPGIPGQGGPLRSPDPGGEAHGGGGPAKPAKQEPAQKTEPTAREAAQKTEQTTTLPAVAKPYPDESKLAARYQEGKRRASEAAAKLAQDPDNPKYQQEFQEAWSVTDGALMAAVAENNPNLARLLSASETVTKALRKVMFFTPNYRLGTHRLQTANILGNVLTRGVMVDENVPVAAIEPTLQLQQVQTFEFLSRMQGLYEQNKGGALKDIDESMFFDMAGYASPDKPLDLDLERPRSNGSGTRRVFDPVDGNPEAQSLVQQAAKEYDDFNSYLLKIGSDGGAFTLSALIADGVKWAALGLDERYVRRLVNKTLMMNNSEAAKERIKLGLNTSRDEWFKAGPNGEPSRMQRAEDANRVQIDRKTKQNHDWLEEQQAEGHTAYARDIEQNNRAIAQLEREIEEMHELRDQLHDRIDDVVERIFSSYVGDVGSPMGTGATASMLSARVLRVRDEFLEPYLVRDVRLLAANAARGLVPDMIISRMFQQMYNELDLSKTTNDALNELTERVKKIEESGRAITMEEHAELSHLADQIRSDAAYMNLIDYVRLVKDYAALGEEVAVDLASRQKQRQYVGVRYSEEQKKEMGRVARGESDLQAAIENGKFSYDQYRAFTAENRIAQLEADYRDALEAWREVTGHADYEAASYRAITRGDLEAHKARYTDEDGALRDDGFVYTLIAEAESGDLDTKMARVATKNSRELEFFNLGGILAAESNTPGSVIVRVPRNSLTDGGATVAPFTGVANEAGHRIKSDDKAVYSGVRRPKKKKQEMPVEDPELDGLRKELRKIKRGSRPIQKPVESPIWGKLSKNPQEAAHQLQSYLYKLRDERNDLQYELREAELAEIREADANSTALSMVREAIERNKRAGDGPRSLRAMRAYAENGQIDDIDLLEALKDLSGYFEALDTQRSVRNQIQNNTVEFHAIASKVRAQNGPNIGQQFEELSFHSTRFHSKWTGRVSEDRADLIFSVDRLQQEIAGRRAASHGHNLDTTQLSRLMEREARARVGAGEMTEAEANKMLYGSDPITGLSMPDKPRRGSAVDDVQTIVERLRMRHGNSADAWRYAGKMVRDLNFTRAMGSVAISSIPDAAMAIGQVGLINYMRTLARFMRRDFKIASETPEGRNDLAILLWSMETIVGQERLRTNFGVDPSDYGSLQPVEGGTRSEKTMRYMADKTDSMVRLFGKTTLLDKWNGLNKGIAAMALQHQAADVSVRLSMGRDVSERDLRRVMVAGFTKEQLRAFGYEIAKHGEEEVVNGRVFYYAKSSTWSNRELAQMWDSGIVKHVNDTIVTVGAGELPTGASTSELGRMLFQFRGFAIAASGRMIVPAIQKFMHTRDMAVPAQMVSMWILGMGVYAINEFMKGNDPFDAIEGRDGERRGAWRKWVFEGLDRSGILGIGMEVANSLERFGAPGPAGLMGVQSASRFRSRGPVEAILGPAIGYTFDAGMAISGVSDFDMTEGEANMWRRMIPWQNWYGTRLLLDVAPNVLDGGGYYEDWRPIQGRVFNYD